MSQQRQQQQQDEPFGQVRRNAAIGFGMLQAVGMTVRPFLSRPGTHGESFYGRHAALGYVVVMPLYFMFWQGDPSAGWLVRFWLASLAALAFQQAAAHGNRKRGYECPSRYDGRPWLPGKDELLVKGKLQPLLVAALGFAALHISPALGLWLMAAALGLAADVATVLNYQRARVRAMRDARFEYLNVSQRFGRR